MCLLENIFIIFWIDVCLLKDSLKVIRRLDFVEILFVFEIKRDLVIFFDLYVREIFGMEICGCFLIV